MEVIPYVLLGTLVVKVFDLLRYGTSRDWNGAWSIVMPWIAGAVGVVALANMPHFGSLIALDLGGGETLTLDRTTLVEQFFMGAGVASTFGLAVDFRRSDARPPSLLDFEKRAA